jgi:hemerythrin
MEWSDRFATGVQRIDDQHRMLFRMTGDFRDALDEGKGQSVYGILLDSLDAYARGHFAFEEDCMFRHQCTIAETNRTAHRIFIENIAQYQSRYVAAGFSRIEARTLLDTLDEWLASHICRIDVQLKDYVQTE